MQHRPMEPSTHNLGSSVEGPRLDAELERITETGERNERELQKAILKEPGTMVIEDCERPQPRSDEVVVKIARVGMCGSDIHGFKFGPYIPPQPGQIVGLGHEPSGVVAEVGADVTHLKVGDRVCLEPGEPVRRVASSAWPATTTCARRWTSLPPLRTTVAPLPSTWRTRPSLSSNCLTT